MSGFPEELDTMPKATLIFVNFMEKIKNDGSEFCGVFYSGGSWWLHDGRNPTSWFILGMCNLWAVGIHANVIKAKSYFGTSISLMKDIHKEWINRVMSEVKTESFREFTIAMSELCAIPSGMPGAAEQLGERFIVGEGPYCNFSLKSVAHFATACLDLDMSERNTKLRTLLGERLVRGSKQFTQDFDYGIQLLNDSASTGFQKAIDILDECGYKIA